MREVRLRCDGYDNKENKACVASILLNGYGLEQESPKEWDKLYVQALRSGWTISSYGEDFSCFCEDCTKAIRFPVEE